jgi:hypothetical protein
MNTSEIRPALSSLYSELVNGMPESNGNILNPGDIGMLRSLDTLSASAVSATNAGGAPIAAHVRHLSYSLSLMNRWANGANSFQGVDWSAAWKTTSVNVDEWKELRADLRRECAAWEQNLAVPREVDDVELAGVLGSIVHLAYHLGAIRQIDREIRGPSS